MRIELARHIVSICKAAGLEVMVDVINVIHDRGDITEETLLTMTDEHVTHFYEAMIAPAIDDIEAELKESEEV